jgi:hypothetical protein
MRGWRAWYANGDVFASTTHAAEDLPREGLEIVVEYLADGYREIHHGEYLYWLDGWHSAVREDAIPAGAIAFPGLLMSDGEFEWLQREAFEAVAL